MASRTCANARRPFEPLRLDALPLGKTLIEILPNIIHTFVRAFWWVYYALPICCVFAPLELKLFSHSLHFKLMLCSSKKRMSCIYFLWLRGKRIAQKPMIGNMVQRGRLLGWSSDLWKETLRTPSGFIESIRPSHTSTNSKHILVVSFDAGRCCASCHCGSAVKTVHSTSSWSS